MIHSDGEIKDNIYSVLKGSALAEAVTGVIKKTKRPLNSSKEDVVIGVITNEVVKDNQFATAYVSIYVQDNDRKGQKEENTTRVKFLASLALALLERHNGGTWRFQVSTVATREEAEEHVINIRLNYYNSLD